MFKKILAFFAAMSLVAAFAAVDVNKATEAELDGLKGVGPVTSKLIISERKKGEFKSWEDFISRVKGVGDNKAAALSSEGLTVGGASYKAATAKADAKADAKAEKAEKKAAKADVKAEAKTDKKADKAEAKAPTSTSAAAVTPAASKPAAAVPAVAAKPSAAASAAAAKPAATASKPAATASAAKK
ncbi:MAG: helix-hairpin-helix domain-containing protein [Pseudomonadota bacterium]